MTIPEQEDLVLSFYQTDPSLRDELHDLTAQISLKQFEQLAKNPVFIAKVQQSQRVVIVPVLRAGLATIKPEVVSQFHTMLSHSGEHPRIDIIPSGFSRIPHAKRAHAYKLLQASSGMDQAVYVISEWGMGVGQTVMSCVENLVDTGVKPDQIFVQALLALDPDFASWIRQNGDEQMCRALTLNASVYGIMHESEIGDLYFDSMYYRGSQIPIRPTDWGDVLWGDWSRPNAENDIKQEIAVFLAALAKYIPSMTEAELDVLSQHYHTKIPTTKHE